MHTKLEACVLPSGLYLAPFFLCAAGLGGRAAVPGTCDSKPWCGRIPGLGAAAMLREVAAILLSLAMLHCDHHGARTALRSRLGPRAVKSLFI